MTSRSACARRLAAYTLFRGALATVCTLDGAVSGALGQTETVNGRTVIHDEGQISIIRGLHPRAEGLWVQYAGETALRKNVVISDVITPDSAWETADGKPARPHAAGAELGTYARHNHYQNLLSEVWNFVPNANAVAIWGDSTAISSGSKAWGGFFSARSWWKSFVDGPGARYVPAGLDLRGGADYDCQLIGLEVDVLNSGKPGLWPNMAKCGIEIVGFGNPNSMAIEVRCEDTDVDTPDRRGQWAEGMYFKNCMTDYGRLIVADFERSAIGLDFRRSLFTQGAVAMRTEGAGTGIVCNQGRSGQMYGGLRRPEIDDPRHWLTLQAGEGGIRVASHDNTREILAVDNDGGVYVSGDLYLNNRRIEAAGLSPAAWRNRLDDRAWLWIVGGLGASVLWLIQKIIRLQIRVTRLMRSVEMDRAGRSGAPA